MNSDPLYSAYNSQQLSGDEAPEQHVFVDRYYDSPAVASAPPLVFHQHQFATNMSTIGSMGSMGSMASNTPVSASSDSIVSMMHSSPIMANPFHVFHDDLPPYTGDQHLVADDPLSPTHPSESSSASVYNSDELVAFPVISTDLSLEKRRAQPPLHLTELYPTPDERYLPSTMVKSEFPQYTTSSFGQYHQGSIVGTFSQPTSPLPSPGSYSHPQLPQQSQTQQQPQQQQQQQQPQQHPHQLQRQSFSTGHVYQQLPERPRLSFSQSTSKMPKTMSFKTSKSRARSVPNLSGIHTTQPGPIPASKPTLNYDQVTGEELLTFSYSKHKIITTFTIKCPPQRVVPDELPEEFLKENCVYPRAMVPVEEYKGNRGRYERECNEIGWTLAWSNPEIRNHRGLVQRAVDSWRNTRSDKAMRSRRVRKTEIKP